MHIAAGCSGGVFNMGTVRTLPGRLSALSVFHSKSVLYGIFVWARRALNHRKRRFPARAEDEEGSYPSFDEADLGGRAAPGGGDPVRAAFGRLGALTAFL